jgi:hypothetical protein
MAQYFEGYWLGKAGIGVKDERGDKSFESTGRAGTRKVNPEVGVDQ